jgi:hypothetical protein
MADPTEREIKPVRCKGKIKTEKGEEDCPESVTWTPAESTIIASVPLATSERPTPSLKSVYLTCQKYDHTCKYWLTPEGNLR